MVVTLSHLNSCFSLFVDDIQYFALYTIGDIQYFALHTIGFVGLFGQGTGKKQGQPPQFRFTKNFFPELNITI